MFICFYLTVPAWATTRPCAPAWGVMRVSGIEKTFSLLGSESDECQLVNLEHFCRSMPTSPSGLKNFRNVVTCDPIFSYREYRTKRKQSEPVGKTGNGALNKVKINGPATEP